MQVDPVMRGSLSIEAAAQRLQPPQQSPDRAPEASRSFDDLLMEAVVKREEPAFSKHAKARMEARGIDLTYGDMLRLKDAIGKAGQKGIQKTLILMGQKAFIVSVPDNTVVTAIEGRDIRENVFTQIDGAVII